MITQDFNCKYKMNFTLSSAVCDLKEANDTFDSYSNVHTKIALKQKRSIYDLIINILYLLNDDGITGCIEITTKVQADEDQLNELYYDNFLGELIHAFCNGVCNDLKVDFFILHEGYFKLISETK